MNIVTDENGDALLFRHNCKPERGGAIITEGELQEFATEVLPYCIKNDKDIIISSIGDNYTLIELSVPTKITIVLLARMLSVNILEEERVFVRSRFKDELLSGRRLAIAKMGFYCLKTVRVGEGICGADYFVCFSGLEYLEPA